MLFNLETGHWEKVADGTGSPFANLNAMSVDPGDPGTILVGVSSGIGQILPPTGGIYKSTDAGKTWTHVGLADTHAISRIRIHPTNPQLVYVSALGHPYGPNAERGVFRSLDGGLTWEKVLYKDENTGAIDLEFDPDNPQIIYADMWASRRPPWTAGNSYNGPGSGLYKSTDGGST